MSTIDLQGVIEDECLDDEEESRIYYEDRTGAETDDLCGMRYWLSRLEGERGIVPKDEPAALKQGREIHEDFAMVAGLPDKDLDPDFLKGYIHPIIDPLTDDDRIQIEKMEVLYRRLGWLVAQALFMEPQLRERFKTVQIEKEIILDRDPLWVGVTPDRVLQSLQDDYLVYKELKTTITANQKWIQSWPFSIQMHIGLAAAEEELNRPIAFGQVQGLMKGDYKYGLLHHPYVRGYRNSQTGAWTHDYDKARTKDWVLTPIWEFEGGIVEWVLKCGREVGMAQFPHSAPVFLNKRMLDLWVERRLYRQIEITEVRSECEADHLVRNKFFPMITRQCRPAFGDPCPYQAVCWNAAVNAAPLAHPDFIPREPHHEIELQVERING